ncbi:hypothetical protein Poly30_40110 [Planctomycetes bacterium Poly30]|uniref:Uncharacterized protein n=2 Tax=Saltatorellus ferox TaxID=2528018 RepID=A0A518EWJ3_9BACT|nr:hypothetical protein Poly30_40110 [Planctomycetes bacterium Poly30]
MAKRGDVYDLLAQIRERPAMFLEDHSLVELEKMLQGYEACLWAHDLEEDPEGTPFHTAVFSDWLAETEGWATDCGFAHAFLHEAGDPKAAFARFFELLDRYRFQDVDGAS